MLKILIVDDEAPTRMRIIKGIDWEEFNISQIIQAEDGFRASKPFLSADIQIRSILKAPSVWGQ